MKTILLNQKLIAGIGNIYADEILFRTRIHPATQASALKEKTITKLFRATRHILKKAIDAQADADRMPKSWLLPDRGKGSKCAVRPLAKIVKDWRSDRPVLRVLSEASRLK